MVMILLGVAVPCARGGPPPADRGRPGRRMDAAAALARVDSLVTAGALDGAATTAAALWEELGADPLFGWQVASRLGLIRLRLGEAAEAVQWCERSLAARPDQAQVHRTLAGALRELGRRGRALAEYDAAVELAPLDADLQLEYGQMLMEYRMWDRAERRLQLAARLCGNCLEAQRALANLALGRGDHATAAELLGGLWRRTGDDRLVNPYLASLVRAGRDSTVLALLDSLPPQGMDPQRWLIAVQAEKDVPGCGAKWSVRALHRPEAGATAGAGGGYQSPPAAFWALVAGNLQRAGRPAQALEALDRALALDPGNRRYLHNRVSVLLDLGREEEARRLWDSIAPGDSTGGADRDTEKGQRR